jgi:spectinomycin phosphotransferase/16S rRNA (guanine(1405)-N(7))-methyltransferase
VLKPPDDLPDEVLATVLADAWNLSVDWLTYRPLGWGSHHWEVRDRDGGRWFATVDELANKRLSVAEPLSLAFDRLRASLATAIDLRASGCAFVVAPVSTSAGEPVVRTRDRFGVAIYPYVDGQSFEWGHYAGPGHREAVLELVVAVHGAPLAARRHAKVDEFAIPHRDELTAGVAGHVVDVGPYAMATVKLLADHETMLRRTLGHYDKLVGEARANPSPVVVTHGEPHPGNTMLTTDGWRLIDWDTVLVAPPERDLWMLQRSDAAIVDAYADATGFTPRRAMLELYEVRWDLADIAWGVDRFRAPHHGTIEDEKSWELLQAQVASLGPPNVDQPRDEPLGQHR